MSELFNIYGRVSIDGVDQAGSRLQSLDRQALTSTGRIGGFSTAIGGIGPVAIKTGLAVAGVGVAIAGAFTVNSIRLAEDFNNAINTLETSTGATQSELAELKDSMDSIYFNNYGDSIEDVADSMVSVKQNAVAMGVETTEQLESVTTQAIIMKDTFEKDVNEIILGSTSLMESFGITSEESFNLMAQGIQQGADKNDDLIDILNEYASMFEELGFNAEEFTSVLITGAESGAWSIDKVGDAYKEFNIRVKDGSDATSEAFQMMNLNASSLSLEFAKGGNSARQAFDKVVNGLFKIENPVKRNTAGVALFGTMWEDLGEKGIRNLTNIELKADKTKDVLSQLDQVKYDSLDTSLEGLKRKFENVQLAAGEKLHPALMDLADYIHATAIPVLDYLTTGSLESLSGMSESTKTKIINFRNELKQVADYITNDLGPAFAYLATGDSSQLGKTKSMSDDTKQEIINLRTQGIEPLQEKFSNFEATGIVEDLDDLLGKVLRIIDAIKTLMGWVSRLGEINNVYSDIESKFNSSAKKAKDIDWGSGVIPQMATGGIATGGLTLVGELGPELVNLPEGSRVFTNQETTSMMNNSFGVKNTDINIKVKIEADHNTSHINKQFIERTITDTIINNFTRYK